MPSLCIADGQGPHGAEHLGGPDLDQLGELQHAAQPPRRGGVQRIRPLGLQGARRVAPTYLGPYLTPIYLVPTWAFKVTHAKPPCQCLLSVAPSP